MKQLLSSTLILVFSAHAHAQTNAAAVSAAEQPALQRSAPALPNEAPAQALSLDTGMPPFLREGDHFQVVLRITNNSGHEQSGQAQLELLDGKAGKPVDGWFQNFFPNQYFTVAAGKTDSVFFPIEAPYQYNMGLTWKVTARVDSVKTIAQGNIPVLKDPEATKARNDLRIQRSFYRIATGKKTLQPVAAGTPLRAGELIVSRVTITAKTKLAASVLTDAYPACLQPVGRYETADSNSVRFTLPAMPVGTHRLEQQFRVAVRGSFTPGYLVCQDKAGNAIRVRPASPIEVE